MGTRRQCAEEVIPEGRWGVFHKYPCQSSATVKAKGKDWCVRHSPEGKAKAAREQEARWDAKSKASQDRYAGEKEMRRRAGVHEQMLEALKAVVEHPLKHTTDCDGSWSAVRDEAMAQAAAAIKAAERGAPKAAKKAD